MAQIVPHVTIKRTRTPKGDDPVVPPDEIELDENGNPILPVDITGGPDANMDYGV